LFCVFIFNNQEETTMAFQAYEVADAQNSKAFSELLAQSTKPD